MTYEQAVEAMAGMLKIEGGEGDGYDTGKIAELIDRETALVGWDSGVQTECAIAILALA